MITESDSLRTYDLSKYYPMLPSANKWKLEDFIVFLARKVPIGFKYKLDKNTEILRKLIIENVNSNFTI